MSATDSQKNKRYIYIYTHREKTAIDSKSQGKREKGLKNKTNTGKCNMWGILAKGIYVGILPTPLTTVL